MFTEGGKLPSEACQTPANVSDAGDSPLPLPTLLIVVSEPLSETHKNAVVNRIATGEVSHSVRCRFFSGG